MQSTYEAMTCGKYSKSNVRISDTFAHMAASIKKYLRFYDQFKKLKRPAAEYGLRGDYMDFLIICSASQKCKNYRCNPGSYREQLKIKR